ncbi:MAG: hypothetical protein Q8P86_01965 [bacterium]|nr:hypothetical protein [bacterium]
MKTWLSEEEEQDECEQLLQSAKRFRELGVVIAILTSLLCFAGFWIIAEGHFLKAAAVLFFSAVSGLASVFCFACYIGRKSSAGAMREGREFPRFQIPIGRG